jgi:hypothetical protein
MATESIISLRGFAKIALALLFFSACLCQGAWAGTTSSVVATGPLSAVATHPATWGQVWNSAISSKGDLVVNDFQNDAYYEFPAGGGSVITLGAAGVYTSGGWTNMSIAFDPWDNLWIGDNWNAEFIRVPYISATDSWDFASGTVVDLGNVPWFQVAGLSFSSKLTNGYATMVIGNENTYENTYNYAVFTDEIDSSGNEVSGTGVTVIENLSARPRSVAIDSTGNIFFYEDGGVAGIREVPAGTTGLSGSTAEAALTRVDPSLSNPVAVEVDAKGDLYISDSSAGVYLVPNENGTLNPSDAYLVTDVPAYANVDFDQLHGIMYIPTKPGSWGGWTSGSVTYDDIAALPVANVSLGTVEVGSQGTTATVNYEMSAGVSPAKITIEEAGVNTPDFVVVSGGTCATGTTYAAQSTCSVEVALSPNSVGALSGKLEMLDASKNVIGTYQLSGTGLGAAVDVLPALEYAVGADITSPAQVATDAAGNVYVAAKGLGKILEYAAGATASTAPTVVAKGLTNPTGVAVDGAGNLFFAANGSVYEIPNMPSGLSSANQITLVTGAGTSLTLAADQLGNVYGADPSSTKVYELINASSSFGPMSLTKNTISGFTAPSVVAVDASNNLYVVDGANLIEVQNPLGPSTTLTTLLTTVTGATGIAFDATGALYVALPGGAVRVPNESGTLTPADATTIGSSVTSPAGLALDKSGNVYLSNTSAANLYAVSSTGALNFGLQSASSTLSAELLNIGNTDLTVSSFTRGNAIDFTASGCTSSVGVNETCSADVIFDPGPGEQGALSGVISIVGSLNGAAIDASGIGAALADSKTTISVGSTANVMSVPVTVTVAAVSGTVVPTGNVVISVDGVAQPAVALANGTVTDTFTSGFAVGKHTFSVEYIGDRVYGRSTASTTATIAQGTPTYIVSTYPGCWPYDGSLNSYYASEQYLITVTGAPGVIPTGTVLLPGGTECINLPSTLLGITIDYTSILDSAGVATVDTYECFAISTYSYAPNELTVATTSVVYSGDANYASVTSSTTNSGAAISFNVLRQPSVLLAPSNAAITVSSSGTGSTTLSITSLYGFGVNGYSASSGNSYTVNDNYPSTTPTSVLNNYTLPVGFSCQGLPAHATCTFSGGNYTDPITGTFHADELIVSTDPGQPGSITVTVNTNVSTGTTTSENAHPAPFEFAAMFGAGLLGLAFGRKSGRKGRILMLLCFVILAGFLGGMTACSTKNLAASPVLTTPAGTYTVTVTAQQVGETYATGSTCPTATPDCDILYGSQNQVSVPYTMTVTVQ